MGDADELDRLRDEYEAALARYEALASALDRRVLAGALLTAQDLEREHAERLKLDNGDAPPRPLPLDAAAPSEQEAYDREHQADDE
jgi:hypothetical protein